MVDGRELHFRLVGINHQNFLMADDETGSWWQQITGESIRGPLRGKRLDRIDSDEVTLGVWRAEQPRSTVVRFVAKYRDKYSPSNWEERIGKLPTVTPRAGDLEPRALVIGIEGPGGAAVAFPLETLRAAKVINAAAGTEPVVVAIGEDGKSVRSFSRRMDGRVLEFFHKEGGGLADDGGGEWSFAGEGAGGKRLARVQNITEYWFDWRSHHPRTAVYRRGR